MLGTAVAFSKCIASLFVVPRVSVNGVYATEIEEDVYICQYE